MRTVNLSQEKLNLEAIIALAAEEPLLLLTDDGKEFFISEADDFDREVEELRASQAFQDFLDERSKSERRISLDELEAEIDEELRRQQPSEERAEQ
ncbi:MAG: hypothetical protein ACREAB_04765 [Blastocatellia bacterium]